MTRKFTLISNYNIQFFRLNSADKSNTQNKNEIILGEKSKQKLQDAPKNYKMRNDELPWRDKMKLDLNCRHFADLRYGSLQQFPVVLLATHEGSGADWFRKMLEISTGYFAGIEDKQRQV